MVEVYCECIKLLARRKGIILESQIFGRSPVLSYKNNIMIFIYKEEIKVNLDLFLFSRFDINTTDKMTNDIKEILQWIEEYVISLPQAS